MSKNLKEHMELLNDHIKNGQILWAQILAAKIENNFNVKIVADNSKK